METASEGKSLRLGLFGGSFDPVHLGHLEIARSAKELFDLDEVHFILANVSPFKFQDKPKDHENAEVGIRQECKRAEILKLALEDYHEDDENAENGDCEQETAAQRAVSRLRRTNDRSVLGVISGDAEDASRVSGSYPSKRKYKLDSSSLHEDHEDDENAENGVVQRSLLISLIIISLFSLPLKAAITGSLTRNPIYLDESTDLIIDLDSSGEEALKFPLHTNSYDVVARQSSSSITIINNKFIQTKQLAYTLRFRRSGVFTLPIPSNMSNDPKAL